MFSNDYRTYRLRTWRVAGLRAWLRAGVVYRCEGLSFLQTI